MHKVNCRPARSVLEAQLVPGSPLPRPGTGVQEGLVPLGQGLWSLRCLHFRWGRSREGGGAGLAPGSAVSDQRPALQRDRPGWGTELPRWRPLRMARSPASRDGSCLPGHLRHPSTSRGQGRKEAPLLGGRQLAGVWLQGLDSRARWACSPSGWAPPPHLGREGGSLSDADTRVRVCPCPGSQGSPAHTALQGVLGTKRGPAAGGVLWGPALPPLPAQPPARAGPGTYRN